MYFDNDFFSYFHLQCLDFGLKCQVCNGKKGACTSFNDNGVSEECSKEFGFCHYMVANNVFFRMCGVQFPQKCLELKRSKKAVVCTCNTDNCNQYNQCDCSSGLSGPIANPMPGPNNPMPNNTVPNNPKPNDPQNTTTSSASTISVSFTLIVSAFALLLHHKFSFFLYQA